MPAHTRILDPTLEWPPSSVRGTNHVHRARPPVAAYFRWKRAIDPPLAALLLVPALPLIGLLWLLVKLTSAGPGFYRQRRAGQYGQPFLMFKLRSMRLDAEARTGAVWSIDGDPRVTSLGRILRKFHLDELPQLFNVLRGEMSLVGPRPERPEFVEVLKDKIEGYRGRLAVKPGITGLAQLNLPPDTDLTSVAQKLALDIDYIEQADLWLETRLLLCTASRLVKIPTVRILGLHRRGTVPAAIVGGSRLEDPLGPVLPIAIVNEPAHAAASHGQAYPTASLGATNGSAVGRQRKAR